jgi:hypothetical protein
MTSFEKNPPPRYFVPAEIPRFLSFQTNLNAYEMHDHLTRMVLIRCVVYRVIHFIRMGRKYK